MLRMYELTCSNPVPVSEDVGQSSLERRKMKTDLTVNEYN